MYGKKEAAFEAASGLLICIQVSVFRFKQTIAAVISLIYYAY